MDYYYTLYLNKLESIKQYICPRTELCGKPTVSEGD